MYEAKVDCTHKQIVKEFRSIWPGFNRVSIQFKNEKKGGIRKFLILILDNYIIQNPNICELNAIMLPVSQATGPMEGSYAKLT